MLIFAVILQDKFAGFNKEMEEISSTQKRYSIPDVELRESLKRDNKEYILPKYNSFYDKYSNVAFTKSPEKYIKYTPAQVSGLIDSFFDVAA
jgi:exocyst complex protein 7